MTKRNTETLTAICETIADGILSYAAAARANNVSVSSFWSWIKTSQKGDESFIITYLEEEIQFAKAVSVARRLALHEMRGRMEQKSIFGYDEPIFYMGQPTWKPDPRCVGLDEETRELLGLPKDGLLRDEQGNCVQNAVHHEPPVALQLRVAEMAFPREYRPGLTSEVNITGGAVVGVQFAKALDYSKPPEIPPPPPLPQLEVLDDEPASFTDLDEDAPEADEPPQAVAPEIKVMVQMPSAPVEPERVIKEVPPLEWTPPTLPAPLAPPRSGRPLSPLEMDLRRRMVLPPEERSKPIGANLYAGERDNVGPGTPPPGGSRIA
jgi:hypothetical protein